MLCVTSPEISVPRPGDQEKVDHQDGDQNQRAEDDVDRFETPGALLDGWVERRDVLMFVSVVHGTLDRICR